MKKVININFQGIVLPIEEVAYDLLLAYIDSLRVYFADEEGRDEIINDIESRIGELFQERLKAGSVCITEEDVDSIIANMGRPSDFEEAEGASSDSSGSSEADARYGYAHDGRKRLYRDDNNKILGGVCSGIGAYLGIDPWIVRILFILSGLGLIAYLILWIFVPASSTVTGYRKRLFRNPDDRIISGVCGGIGSYFNINSWIPRVIFLLPFISFFFRWQTFGPWTFPNFIQLTFSPGTFLVYIVLWLVIPEAKTASEKLQMKGEKVDLNSIKESVIKEMKDVASRVGKYGKDADAYMKERGPHMKSEFQQSINNTGTALGNIIATLIKVLVYIIVGAVAFTVLAVVFAIGIAAVAVFPLKDFVVTNGWQNILAWLTLIFFIGVPVVGTIAFVIRAITRRTRSNNYMRNIGTGLWIFGWICVFALFSMVGRDFRYVGSTEEQSLPLIDSGLDILEIRPLISSNTRWRSWNYINTDLDIFVSRDTALVPNMQLRILQAPGDEYDLRYATVSNGPTRNTAETLAAQITLDSYQQDSVVYLQNALKINTTDKFRNQFADVVVYVPVNRRIKIDSKFSQWDRHDIRIFRRTDRYIDRIAPRNDYPFQTGVEYIMREDGLHPVEKSRGGGRYEYESKEASGLDSLKALHEKELREMERSMDSVRKRREDELKRAKDSLKKRIAARSDDESRTGIRISADWPSLPTLGTLKGFFSFL